MKQPTQFLLLVLFAVTINMGAQQLKPADLLNPKKIEAVVSLTESQKEALVLALDTKEANLTKTEDSDLKRDINNTYIKELYQILTDEQSQKIIKAQIDHNDIESKVDGFYNEKTGSKGFPKDYLESFRDVIIKFQYDITYTDIKYMYDEVLQEQERDSILLKRNNWFSEHVKTLKHANILWNVANRKCNSLQEFLKEDFINYHLYSNFNKNAKVLNVDIDQKRDALIKKADIKALISLIINCNSSTIVSRYERYLQDSTTHQYVKKGLDSVFKNNMKRKIASSENLIETGSPLGSTDIMAFIKLKKEELKTTKNNNALKDLIKKAKKAGLEEVRVKQFIALIDKKEKDIAAFKAARTTNTTSNILEINTQKTMSQIKKDFSKDLSSLISKKEFAEILSDDFKPTAIKKAKEELKEVLASYKLTEEQRKIIYKKIALYYLNETIAKAYYAYDRKTLNQKLSGLRYYFEKDYKETMDGFDIKMTPSKKAKKNTYQY